MLKLLKLHSLDDCYAPPSFCAADFLGNFGHVLYDFLFPVFNMLQLLGLYTPDFQLIYAKHQVCAIILVFTFSCSGTACLKTRSCPNHACGFSSSETFCTCLLHTGNAALLTILVHPGRQSGCVKLLPDKCKAG